MSGTIGKPTFQGRRSRKWKLYDKRSWREKGKFPKYMTKFVIKKVGKFWQRRAQFPFGDSVSKADKIIKMRGIKATNL